MTQAGPTDSVATMLTAYRYAVGLLVPLAMSAIGIVGKKVARGAGWERSDFYIGTELTAAGVTGALVNLCEFMKPDRTTFGLLEKKLLGGNIAIAIFGLFFYYLTLSLRQDFGPESGKSTAKQLVAMLGFSNVIGLATLVGALLLMAP